MKAGVGGTESLISVRNRRGERVKEIKDLSFGEQRRETAQKWRDKELKGSG